MALMSSRDLPAERMASSWVQSTATTTSPSGVEVDSHWEPSREKESLEMSSSLAVMVRPSKSSVPFSRMATAS